MVRPGRNVYILEPRRDRPPSLSCTTIIRPPHSYSAVQRRINTTLSLPRTMLSNISNARVPWGHGVPPPSAIRPRTG
ncbi:hypothetical protein B0H10DRAFT_2192092, partial [Mycena sp. CBHHK59/15]